MNKIDRTNPETRRILSALEDEILELIDNQDEYTRSDLQGRVSVLVVQILTTKLPK